MMPGIALLIVCRCVVNFKIQLIEKFLGRLLYVGNIGSNPIGNTKSLEFTIMEITLWMCILFVLYLIWSLFSIRIIVKMPNKILRKDPDTTYYDYDGFEGGFYYTPFTNLWIIITAIVFLLLTYHALGFINWNKVIFVF